MTVYTTAFLFRKGIVQVEVSNSLFSGYYELKNPIDAALRIIKKECFDNFEDALKRAAVLKKRRIQQMENDLKSVRELVFTNPEHLTSPPKQINQ